MDSKIIIIESPEKINALVNKKRSLSDNYIPNDLVDVEVLHKVEKPESKMLRKVASDALTELFEAAKQIGFEFWAVSGYRSYDRQVYYLTIMLQNMAKKRLTVSVQDLDKANIKLALQWMFQ